MMIVGKNVDRNQVPAIIAKHFSLLDIAVNVTTVAATVTVPNMLWKILPLTLCMLALVGIINHNDEKSLGTSTSLTSPNLF